MCLRLLHCTVYHIRYTATLKPARLHTMRVLLKDCTVQMRAQLNADCGVHAVKKQIIGGDVKLCKCYFYMHADRVCGGRHYGALDEC